MTDAPIDPSVVEALLAGTDSFSPDEAQLLDAQGRISYALGLGSLRVSAGIAQVTIPPGSDFAGRDGIPHGLGQTPGIVLATPLGPFDAIAMVPDLSTLFYSPTTFAVQTSTPGYTAGVGFNFAYLAIG